jgi:cardiolipin synthase
MGMSPVRRAFIILLVAAAIIVLGLLFAQDQVTLKIRSSVSAGDQRHPDYVAALVGTELSRGNGFDVLTNGDQIFPAMLGAIDGARRRISFETYIFDTGEVARRFTEALEKAARRGVTVNMVIDAVGASKMEKAQIDRLRQAGSHVAQFNAPAWYSLEEINYRTHRKILVVDGEVAFTGGVGVADHWIGNADSKDHWRDTHVRVRGPVVRMIEAAFYENFLEADGTAAPELDAAPPPVGEQGEALVVRSSPSGGSNDLKRLYLLAIAAASHRIDITTPYFVTDESTLWSLEDAVRRGVKVRVLMEGSLTDAMPVKYASRHMYDRLLQQGIELYEYQPTMMHTKTLVVDGIWSIFGSANFDNRSLELNDEMNVAVNSRSLARRFTDDLEEDLQRSHRITLEDWRQRPRIDKLRERFWTAFAEVF